MDSSCNNRSAIPEKRISVGLRYLVDNQHFRICNLLPTDRFVSFCGERNIRTSGKALERLEQLGIFYPVARTTSWPYKAKIKPVNEQGGYELLGPLAPDEAWDGETRVEYAQFYFGRPDTAEWLLEGHLWDPRSKPFEAWDSFRSGDGISRMVSHYSPFQAYELWHRMNGLKCEISAEFWILDPPKASEQITEWAQEMLQFAQKHFYRYDISRLCQVLSNRYYPLTQTNQRFITLSEPHNWSWYECCDRWNASQTLSGISLEATDIRRAWEMLLLDAKHCDPMEQWYNLISFTAIEQRSKLKGDALRAQTWYAMEHMLRLFYFDLTGEELPTPEGPITYKFVPGAEAPIELNPLYHLEQVTNEFNINPRPVLILLVEGESEAQAIPQIMERVFGVQPRVLGIQIISLKGIGNIDGSDRYDPQGALVRFVDDYHSRGTIVFIIMDNEGKAKKTRGRLLRAHSLYQNRLVTRPEYVVVWEKNIELDNFSDAEIAYSMNQLVAGGLQVSEVQIATVRTRFRAPKDGKLESVFEATTTRTLDKPHLLKLLTDIIAPGDVKSDSLQKRPILKVLESIVKLAHQNGPQSSRWRQDYLASSGLYGEMLVDSSVTPHDSGDSGGQ